MKSNMSMINIDDELLKLIYKDLDRSEGKSKYKENFLRKIESMLAGEISSLLLMKSDAFELPDDETDRSIKVGEIEIDKASRLVKVRGEEVILTPKEFDLLYFLMKNRGEVFTKEQIYRAVWKDNYLYDDSNIMAFIRKIRKKIEPHQDSPRYILTVWGIGYKFNDKI